MRILHCLRAPVGGLFRHVADLAREQSAAGHDIGVIADSTTTDSLTAARLKTLARHLSLGLHQVAMSRSIGPRDVTATVATARIAARLNADILHGHGAKGGAHARLAIPLLRRKRSAVKCFYTPHGGSLHFPPRSIQGQIYMALEHQLLRMTEGIIFESEFALRTFSEKVGSPTCNSRVVYNGVAPVEFAEHKPEPAATDFLFIGELRHLKGVDVLLRAVATLQQQQPATVTIVGEGPDSDAFKALAAGLGIASDTIFTGALPASSAFPRGRVLVVPSRAESLPYIVLEAAAGSVPLIATAVGGIPEIVQSTDTQLVPPDNVDALAAQLAFARQAPAVMMSRATTLQQAIRDRFSTRTMASAVTAFYSSAAAS